MGGKRGEREGREGAGDGRREVAYQKACSIAEPPNMLMSSTR